MTFEEMCQAGLTVNHSTDEVGAPDVGLSVGLGDGKALFVGDLPEPFSVGLCIYTGKGRLLIADRVDREMGMLLVNEVSSAIRRALSEDQTNG